MVTTKSTPASPGRKRIACIGECLVELRGNGENNFATAFAGDTLNTATYLSRTKLHDVYFVSVVGCDEISQRMIGAWRSEGIDTSLVGRHEHRLPGIYLIENDECGERKFHYWRSESAARTLFLPESGVTTSSLTSVDVVYISGITLAIMRADARAQLADFLAMFRRQGGLVAFDSNYRPRLWESVEVARRVISEMWANTDIALPSLDDEANLFGENENQVTDRLLDAGAGELLIKRGEQYPIVFSDGVQLPGIEFAHAHKVVDTTGAGDSFNAGYLAQRLAGTDIPTAVASAHKLASKVIVHPGAILPMA